MQLIQAWVASERDIILVTDDFNPSEYPDQLSAKLIQSKGLVTLSLSLLPEYIESLSSVDWQINPWGWNHSLKASLGAAGIKESLLKTDREIDNLRQLAHRHTVIPFQKMLQSILPNLEITEAKEFFSVKEAMDFARMNGDVFFKAPWSSSGRGLLRITSKGEPVSRQLPEKKLMEWINGFIRRQGSIMGEKAFRRIADFATEWNLNEGKAEFLGLSFFTTSEEGRYLGNSVLSQQEIANHLSALSTSWNIEIILAQQKCLETLIAPAYSGPAGIDMLIDDMGRINPCVEINLRTTMGMIELFRQATLSLAYS